MRDLFEPTTLQVFRDQQLVLRTSIDKPLEIGRQRIAEPLPFVRIAGESADRIVIAAMKESRFSRSHFQVEPTDAGRIRVRNTSRNRIVRLDVAAPLLPGEQCTVDAATIRIEDLVMQIGTVSSASEEISTLDTPTQLKLDKQSLDLDVRQPPLTSTLDSNFGPEEQEILLRWLRQIALVCQHPASSPDFLDLASRALVRIADFDRVSIARLGKDGGWSLLHSFPYPDDTCVPWIGSKLSEVVATTRRTAIRGVDDASETTSPGPTTRIAEAMCPMFDTDGALVGAMFIDRHERPGQPITRFEACIAELIASAIAAGWNRLGQEQGRTVP